MVDDKYEGRVTSSTKWELYNIYLESGQHEVTWMYTADVPSGYSGGKTTSSASYLDDLNFIPDLSSVLDDNTQTDSETTIEIKLKPYADLDWRNKILFEPYVPSPIVSASCSNKCPCSFTPYDEGVCQCGIEMACGGTIPIDLASGNELKFVWEASSDNDKYISVTGTSQTRVEIRLTIQDCTAPYQLIHGSNVTIVIDGLDGIEQKFTYDPESSFVDLGSCDGCGDICDVFTRMVFNPNENGVLDMKFTTLTFTAGYDNRKVTDETSYTWATDSYTWIRQPEGGSIKLLDIEEPWEVEETSPLSTDTPSKQMTFPPYSFDSTFFSSSDTPTVAICPEEETAFQNCITVDVDNIGSFVDCSLCGLEAMGDDIFDFSGYCERWDSCVSEMCPESCVEPINAYQLL